MSIDTVIHPRISRAARPFVCCAIAFFASLAALPSAFADYGVEPAAEGDSSETDTLTGSNKPRTRGTWLSTDLTLFGFQSVEVGRSSTWVGSMGLAATPFNFGVGYQHESYLLGVRLGMQGAFGEGSSDTTFTFKLAARVENVFGKGSSRGFIAFEPGFAMIPVGRKTVGTMLTAASAGGHFFVGRSFSIDPYAELGVQYVPDYEATGYSGRVGMMLSGWIW